MNGRSATSSLGVTRKRWSSAGETPRPHDPEQTRTMSPATRKRQPGRNIWTTQAAAHSERQRGQPAQHGQARRARRCRTRRRPRRAANRGDRSGRARSRPPRRSSTARRAPAGEARRSRGRRGAARGQHEAPLQHVDGGGQHQRARRRARSPSRRGAARAAARTGRSRGRGRRAGRPGRTACAFTYCRTVSHAAAPRPPAKRAITPMTGSSSRLTSGSRIARPGRPSWSSSSQ